MPTLSDIGIISALIGMIIGLWKSFRTTPKEIKKVDADLSKQYSDMLQEQLQRFDSIQDKYDELRARVTTTEDNYNNLRRENDILRGRIATLEGQKEDLECRIGDMDKVVKDRDILIDEWTTGIGILIEQIEKDFQGVPKWYPKKRRL